MIDGFDDDDQWRMVEDEFYAVAGHFTAHLHAAQYRRLREEAKKQNADTIPTISRPVTAPPTSQVKRRQAALALAAAQRKGVKNALSRINGEETEDEDDELPWKGTHLAGLMNSPRKKAQPLPNITSTLGGPRAAASGTHKNGIASSSTSRLAFPNHRGDPFLVRNTSHVSRPHTTSQRYQTLDESDDDDDLEQCSSRQPSTQQRFLKSHPRTANIETLQSSQSRPASSPTGAAHALKGTTTVKPSQISRSSSTAVVPVPNEHDSDSGQETYFQRRMRERRGRLKLSRHKSSTPDEPAGPRGKEESQPSQQKSQNSQNSENTILIVPSF